MRVQRGEIIDSRRAYSVEANLIICPVGIGEVKSAVTEDIGRNGRPDWISEVRASLDDDGGIFHPGYLKGELIGLNADAGAVAHNDRSRRRPYCGEKTAKHGSPPFGAVEVRDK